MMAFHVPGQELARSFYSEIIQHLIDIPHAAALLGEGSEVLGYDQPRSTDHNWGPRLQIFVESSNIEKVSLIIERGLPAEFKGYPVRFYSWQTKTVRHHVEVTTLDRWLISQLRISHPSELTPAKWLTIPQQHLLQFTAGAVFRDDPGKLQDIRKQLSWYPTDVWLWMMASQWHLIGNTQPILGRTIEVPDFKGSLLITFRLVRLIMELSFLQERQYWPYLKWFGTAFSRLNIASILGPIIDIILQSNNYAVKENEINRALKLLGEQHNSLALTPVVIPSINDFEVGLNNAVRPYRVINAGEFVKACRNSISDKRLLGIPTVGAIDQLTHVDDLLVNFTSWPHQFELLYQTDPIYIANLK
jgi:hypothetical protein